MTRHVSAALALVLLAAAAIGAQANHRASSVQRAASAADLRAATAEEMALAEFFDAPGESIFETKTIGIVVEESWALPLPTPPGVAPPKRPSREDKVRAGVCGADVVFTGHPTGQKTLLNKSESRLFTVSSVAVELWVRPASGRSTLDAGFLGGEVQWQEQTLLTAAGPRPTLGKPYLFFLKRVPKSSAYFGVSFVGFDAGKIAGGRHPDELGQDGNDVETLLAEVRRAALGCSGWR